MIKAKLDLLQIWFFIFMTVFVLFFTIEHEVKGFWVDKLVYNDLIQVIATFQVLILSLSWQDLVFSVNQKAQPAISYIYRNTCYVLQ